MAAQHATALRIGQVFEIDFPAFRPRITVQSDRQLTVAVPVRDKKFLSQTVEYEAVMLREGLVMVTWREHLGSTVVHILDFDSNQAHTAVTSAQGEFMRLRGKIESVRDWGTEVKAKA